MLIAGLLVAVGALALALAMARLRSRRSTKQPDGLGTVSQQWLALHRTEN